MIISKMNLLKEIIYPALKLAKNIKYAASLWYKYQNRLYKNVNDPFDE